MNFASKFVLNKDVVEYECVSDDEFQSGMQLSGSSSEDSDDGTDGQNKSTNTKGKKEHHWKQNQKMPALYADVKRWFRRADTNVVSVSFDTLMSPCSMHAGDPVICSTCHAILSHISKPLNEDDNMIWKCEFCDNSMLVDIVSEEIPSSEEVTYLMEPGNATRSSTLCGRDESLVVFCVDTSGSMCVTSEVEGKVKLRGNRQLEKLDSFNTEGDSQYLPSQKNHNVTYVSRLQAMQAAVEHQLGEMAKNFPHRRVALVAFSSDVTIVGDGYQEEVVVAGDKLSNMEQLSQIGSTVNAPQPIQKTCKKLGDKVYRLEEGGSTALGPALVIAVNMASSHPGSKVILCTDGKANVGLGNLDEDNDVGTEFYTNIGTEALSKGVSVSVTTIQGTDCKLVHLGQLADKTGGQVNIVDPLNLTKEFGNILADQIIATNVKSKFLVHKELYIVDENDPSSKKCLAEFSPGNVQTSTTITFEFARKNVKDKKEETVYDNSMDEAIYNNNTSNTGQATDQSEEQDASASVASSSESDREENLSEFPFQLQIEYTDTEGTKALRVITRSLPATTNREEAESNADLEVLGSHAAKASADLALQGEYSKSRGKALMNQRLAWRSSHTDDAPVEKKHIYKNIYSRIQSMENRLQRKQTQEIISRGCTYSDDEGDECDYFEEHDRGAEGLSQPAASQPRRKKLLKKTKHSERSINMEDSLANMVYNFRRTSHRDIAAQELALPPPSLPVRKSKNKEDTLD